MSNFDEQRARMVRDHIAARGVGSAHVLSAMRVVPREVFVPEALSEFAYDDTPLPIAADQTISQPFIVAHMLDAAKILPGDRVLEIGTGSGYAAAVISRIAAQVFTIERHRALARSARDRLLDLGYENVSVLEADGTLGWVEHAPYDAMIVSAGGPAVPKALLEQLAIGGRLVIPVGANTRSQRLLRVTRRSTDDYVEDDLGAVSFVPLIGAHGWDENVDRPADAPGPIKSARSATGTNAVARLIHESAETIDDIDSVSLGPLLERIGNAQVVLLGEATHGTSEFYRMRARITRELILRRGFRVVAIEADWPDASVIDRYVRHLPPAARPWPAFARFPAWMWRNRETLELTEWLREYNRSLREPRQGVSFHGLDLYSLYTSAAVVLSYLDRVDPTAARVARERYGCLSPWEGDPAAYGRAAVAGEYRRCEREVVQTLRDLFARRLDYAAQDGDDFLDAVQNARLVADAERYYRIMYYGSVASWNLRDEHMFDTLELLRTFHGDSSKIVVWEHNSHIGDARATEMGARGEHNVGSLCREKLADRLYSVGFGTDNGSVAAASGWDEPMQVMKVRPARADSYEGLFHAARIPAGLVHLRHPRREAIREELAPARLERAIGVVYRPETELQSHYFHASLPHQFDEYVWFDRSSAVTPLPSELPVGVPDTYPFGL
jgi:protein-L-isoaspartate(D-aspartate) O-methyltransferase